MKYIVISFLVIIAFGIYSLLKVDYLQLNPVQKFVSQRIYKKWDEKVKSFPKDERAIVDYDDLVNELSIFERIFVSRVFAISPKDLGFKGPFYSTDKPGKLVKLSSVILMQPGNRQTETGVQFYPAHEYGDFQKMTQDMKNEIGKTLYIGSGYRSPGRQAYLFFKYLVTSSKFCLKENAKWIAMPGFSEHGNPLNTSIDFENENGINGIDPGQSPEDFEKLPEYKWLQDNAGKYNFYLSYPRNNKYGVSFEPWHWHWERKS